MLKLYIFWILGGLNEMNLIFYIWYLNLFCNPTVLGFVVGPCLAVSKPPKLGTTILHLKRNPSNNQHAGHQNMMQIMRHHMQQMHQKHGSNRPSSTSHWRKIKVQFGKIGSYLDLAAMYIPPIYIYILPWNHIWTVIYM